MNATFAATAMAGALCPCAHARAQLPPADHGVAAYLALAEGAAWIYRTESSLQPGLPPVESRCYVGALGRYRQGAREFWMVRTVTDAAAVEHWQLAPDGLLVRPGVATAEVSEADLEAIAQRPLASPVGAVTEWSWRVPRSPQQGGGPDQPQFEDWTARIEQLDAAVTVPAGTFHALHVRATARPSGAEQQLWFARDVGIVRAELRAPWRREVRELIAHRPGPDAATATAARSALLRLLPPDWLESSRGPASIGWLETGAESLSLPGRFALIEIGGEHRCAFVGRDFCLPLDPGSTATWRDLFARCEVPDRPTPHTLARLLARLLAHRDDLRVEDFAPDDAPPRSDRDHWRHRRNPFQAKRIEQPFATRIDLSVLRPDGRKAAAFVDMDFSKPRQQLEVRGH